MIHAIEDRIANRSPLTLFVVTLSASAILAWGLDGNLVTSVGGWLSLCLTFRLGQIVGREEAHAKATRAE